MFLTIGTSPPPLLIRIARENRTWWANDRRANIYFNILSPAPGTFLIALHFKGRDKPILEMDLKIDDLLEKVSCLFSSSSFFEFPILAPPFSPLHHNDLPSSTLSGMGANG